MTNTYYLVSLFGRFPATNNLCEFRLFVSIKKRVQSLALVSLDVDHLFDTQLFHGKHKSLKWILTISSLYNLFSFVRKR